MADENPLNPRNYLNGDGFWDATAINWRKLLVTVVGGTAFAYFRGVASLILALADYPIAITQATAGWLARLVRTLLGPLDSGLYQAWIQTLPIVQSSGPLSFVVSIAILLAASYVFWRTLRLVIGRG